MRQAPAQHSLGRLLTLMTVAFRVVAAFDVVGQNSGRPAVCRVCGRAALFAATAWRRI